MFWFLEFGFGLKSGWSLITEQVEDRAAGFGVLGSLNQPSHLTPALTSLLQVEGTTIGFGRMVAGLPPGDLPSTPLAHNVGAGQVGARSLCFVLSLCLYSCLLCPRHNVGLRQVSLVQCCLQSFTYRPQALCSLSEVELIRFGMT